MLAFPHNGMNGPKESAVLFALHKEGGQNHEDKFYTRGGRASKN